jgi:hypothetical protein
MSLSDALPIHSVHVQKRAWLERVEIIKLPQEVGISNGVLAVFCTKTRSGVETWLSRTRPSYGKDSMRLVLAFQFSGADGLKEESNVFDDAGYVSVQSFANDTHAVLVQARVLQVGGVQASFVRRIALSTVQEMISVELDIVFHGHVQQPIVRVLLDMLSNRGTTRPPVYTQNGIMSFEFVSPQGCILRLVLKHTPESVLPVDVMTNADVKDQSIIHGTQMSYQFDAEREKATSAYSVRHTMKWIQDEECRGDKYDKQSHHDDRMHS